MRIVIQRVKKAKVRVRDRVIGEIGRGLFVLVGVGRNDKLEYAKGLAEKLVNMRIMADKKKKMNLSIRDAGGEILAVSQFTLYADTNYGRRPSFIKAAIIQAEEAVAAQSGKDYTLAISDETRVKAESKTARDNLLADLKKTREVVAEAKKAVVDAIRVAATTLGGKGE